MANTPNYDVNYDDERLVEVKSQGEDAIKQTEAAYDEALGNMDGLYETKEQEIKDWAKEQTKLQQERTDFTIDQIEQQKEQTKKDYLKEQSGAYTDWQKQSGKYGVNAEQMAAQGLKNSGYSESSQVSLYNTYQNRISTAREIYSRAILNYDNAIKEAQLQNSSILAEIAHNALVDSMNLALEAAQYKNGLIIDKANQLTAIKQNTTQNWLSVLNLIDSEAARAQQAAIAYAQMEQSDRHFKDEMDWQKEQWEAEQAFAREQFEWQKAQADVGTSGDGSDSGSGGGSGGGNSEGIGNGDSGGSPGGVRITKEKNSTMLPKSVTTYRAAINYMRNNGVPNAEASEVMTKSQWQRVKSSYNYDTYEDYLADQTLYLVSRNAKIN